MTIYIYNSIFQISFRLVLKEEYFLFTDWESNTREVKQIMPVEKVANSIYI